MAADEAIGLIGGASDRPRRRYRQEHARRRARIPTPRSTSANPLPSWPNAWRMILARTIEVFDALREELATLSP